MPERFDDLPALAELGARVHDAAVRAATPGPRRWSPRLLAVLLAICVPVAAGTAGATLLVLRGSAIPASAATPPEQLPQPGSGRLAAVTAADPQAGQPRWTLRLSTSRTGLSCSTVGQLVGGRFGLVGLDGRFRRLDPAVADAYSVRRHDAATLVGARTFDARRRADVRTVVSGVAGPELRAVSVEAAGQRRAVGVHRTDGTFVMALRGLPEDLGLRVRLRFADGQVEDHPFGVAPMVLADPDSGPAWRVGSFAFSDDARTTCVSLSLARQRGSRSASSPAACGRLGGTPAHRTGFFLSIRRVVPSTGRQPAAFFGGAWYDTPPRLLAYGAVGQDVATIDVRGPRGEPRTDTFFAPNGSFASMFGPRVRPGQVTVVLRMKDGRRRILRASQNLTRTPRP